MKKFFLMALFVLFSGSVLFAQSQLQDVVYLKNGSVIKGQIIELVPAKSVQLEIADGSIVSYEMEQVDRIVRDKSAVINQSKENESYKSNFGSKMFYAGIDFGPGMPLGNFKDSFQGLKMEVLYGLEAGAFLNKNLAASLYWFGSSWNNDANSNEALSVNGLTFGLHAQTNGKIKGIAHFRMGMMWCDTPEFRSNDFFNGKEALIEAASSRSVGYDLGLGILYELWESLSLDIVTSYKRSSFTFRNVNTSVASYRDLGEFYKLDFKEDYSVLSFLIGLKFHF